MEEYYKLTRRQQLDATDNYKENTLVLDGIPLICVDTIIQTDDDYVEHTSIFKAPNGDHYSVTSRFTRYSKDDFGYEDIDNIDLLRATIVPK